MRIIGQKARNLKSNPGLLLNSEETYLIVLYLAAHVHESTTVDTTTARPRIPITRAPKVTNLGTEGSTGVSPEGSKNTPSTVDSYTSKFINGGSSSIMDTSHVPVTVPATADTPVNPTRASSEKGGNPTPYDRNLTIHRKGVPMVAELPVTPTDLELVVEFETSTTTTTTSTPSVVDETTTHRQHLNFPPCCTKTSVTFLCGIRCLGLAYIF